METANEAEEGGLAVSKDEERGRGEIGEGGGVIGEEEDEEEKEELESSNGGEVAE